MRVAAGSRLDCAKARGIRSFTAYLRTWGSAVPIVLALHHHHSTPNLYRLGVFISGFRDTTRGSAQICMCHAVAARRPEVARFDSLLL